MKTELKDEKKNGNRQTFYNQKKKNCLSYPQYFSFGFLTFRMRIFAEILNKLQNLEELAHTHARTNHILPQYFQGEQKFQINYYIN